MLAAADKVSPVVCMKTLRSMAIFLFDGGG